MKLKFKKERKEQILTPQKLTNGRVLSLDVPQSLTLQRLTPKGLNPTRAFSVAEAMIALLIGTIVLGFSAPMITKQLKHNNFTSIQTQIMNKKIENVQDISDANAGKISQIIGTKTPSDYATYIRGLETNINNLLNNQNIKNVMSGVESTDYDDDIATLQKQIDAKVSTATLNNKISSLNTSLTTSLTNKITTEINKLKEDLKSKFVPSGAVMFFDLDACPSGWTALNSGGAFIRDVGGESAQRGVSQEAGVPNITGWYDSINGGEKAGGAMLVTTGSDPLNNHHISSSYGHISHWMKFDASRSSTVYKDGLNEVRPKNIAYLACRKN